MSIQTLDIYDKEQHSNHDPFFGMGVMACWHKCTEIVPALKKATTRHAVEATFFGALGLSELSNSQLAFGSTSLIGGLFLMVRAAICAKHAAGSDILPMLKKPLTCYAIETAGFLIWAAYQIRDSQLTGNKLSWSIAAYLAVRAAGCGRRAYNAFRRSV